MSTLRNIKTLQYDAELLSNNSSTYINRSLANLGQRQGEQGDGIEVRQILLSEIIQQMIENDNTFQFVDYTHSVVNNAYDFINVEYKELYDESSSQVENYIIFTPLKANYIDEYGNYTLTPIDNKLKFKHTFKDTVKSIENSNVKNISLDYTSNNDKIIVQFNYAYNQDSDFSNNTNVKIIVSEKIAGFQYEDGVDEYELTSRNLVYYSEAEKKYYLVVDGKQYNVNWDSEAYVDGFSLDQNASYSDEIHDILIRINYCYDVVKDIIDAQNKLMATNQLADLLIGIIKSLSTVHFSDNEISEEITNVTISHNYPFYLIYNVNTEKDNLLMCNAAPIKIHVLAKDYTILNINEYSLYGSDNFIFCNGNYTPNGQTRTLQLDCFYDEKVINYITLKTSQFKITHYDPFIGNNNYNWYVNNINTNIRAAGRNAGNPNIVFVKTDINGSQESQIFDEYSSISAEIIGAASNLKFDSSVFISGVDVNIQNGYTELDPYDKYVYLVPDVSPELEDDAIYQLCNVIIANTSNIIKVKNEELSNEQNVPVYEYKRSTVKQTTFWTFDLSKNKFVYAEYNVGNEKFPVTLSHIEGVNEYTRYIFNTSPETAQFQSKVKEMTEFETLRFSTKQVGLKNNESIIVYPSIRSGYNNDFLDDDVNKLQLKYVTGNHIIDTPVDNLIIPLDRVKSENSMHYYLGYDIFKNLYIDIKGNRILPNKDVISNTYQYDKIQMPIMDVSEILINKQTVLNRINLQILDSNSGELAVPYYVYMGRRPYENNSDTKEYYGYKFNKNDDSSTDIYYPAFYIGSHFINHDLGEESLAHMNFKSRQKTYTTLISDFIDNKFVKITPKFIVSINDNVILNEIDFFNKNQNQQLAIFNNLIVAEKFRIDRKQSLILFDESLPITKDYNSDTSESKAYIKSLYVNIEYASIINTDKGFANEFDVKQLYALNQTLKDTFTLQGKILMKVDADHQYTIQHNGNATLDNINANTVNANDIFGKNVVANNFSVINDNVAGVIAGYNDNKGYNIFESPYNIQGWYLTRVSTAVVLNKKLQPWGLIGDSANDVFVNYQNKKCVNLNYYISDQISRIKPSEVVVSKDVIIKDNDIYLLPLDDVQEFSSSGLWTASSISVSLVISGKDLFIYAWRIGTDFYDIDSLNAAIGNLNDRLGETNGRIDDINTAISQEVTYQIIFNSNGGTTCPTIYLPLNMISTYTATFPIPTNGTREFKGWKSEDDETLTLTYDYLAGQNFKINVIRGNGLNLKQDPWEINRSISFIADWGEEEMGTIIYRYCLDNNTQISDDKDNTVTIPLSIPYNLTLNSYKYNGKEYSIQGNKWHRDSLQGAVVVNNVITLTPDNKTQILYCVLTQNNVKWEFRYMDDTTAYDTQTVSVGSKYALPSTVNNSSFNLTGWFVSKTSYSKLAKGSEYTAETDAIFYAAGEFQKFTLNVQPGKSSYSLSSSTTFLGSSIKSSYSLDDDQIGIKLSLPILSAPNSTFKGWVLKDKSEIVVTGKISEDFTELTLAQSDDNYTLCGVWGDVKYSYLIFDCGTAQINGNDVDMAWEWSNKSGSSSTITDGSNLAGSGSSLHTTKINIALREYKHYDDGTYTANFINPSNPSIHEPVTGSYDAPPYPGYGAETFSLSEYARYSNSWNKLSATDAAFKLKFDKWLDGSNEYDPEGSVPDYKFDSPQSISSLLSNKNIKHILGTWKEDDGHTTITPASDTVSCIIQVKSSSGYKYRGRTINKIRIYTDKRGEPYDTDITSTFTLDNDKKVSNLFNLNCPNSKFRLCGVYLYFTDGTSDNYGGPTLYVGKTTNTTWYNDTTSSESTYFDPEHDKCNLCIECHGNTTTTTSTTITTSVKVVFNGGTMGWDTTKYAALTGGKLKCIVRISYGGTTKTLNYSDISIDSYQTLNTDLSFAHGKKAGISISDINVENPTAAYDGVTKCTFYGFTQDSRKFGMTTESEGTYITYRDFTDSNGLYNGQLITINIMGLKEIDASSSSSGTTSTTGVTGTYGSTTANGVQHTAVRIKNNSSKTIYVYKVDYGKNTYTKECTLTNGQRSDGFGCSSVPGSVRFSTTDLGDTITYEQFSNLQAITLTKSDEFTINFHGNGGKISGQDSVFYEVKPTDTKMCPIATRDGYTFTGWTKNSEAISSTNPVYLVENAKYQASSGVRQLYAQWTKTSNASNTLGSVKALECISYVKTSDAKTSYIKNASSEYSITVKITGIPPAPVPRQSIKDSIMIYKNTEYKDESLLGTMNTFHDIEFEYISDQKAL